MRRFLLTILCVILVIGLLVAGGCGLYFSNQTKVNEKVDEMLGGADGQDGKDGVDGQPGKDGVDGQTPYIGENGNWWIGDTDTGCQVTVAGKPGMSAYEVAVENGFIGTETEWLASLRGADGQNGAAGQDGQTPYIGENGNWWIGNTDTGCQATGTVIPAALYYHNVMLTGVTAMTPCEYKIYLQIYSYNQTPYNVNTLCAYLDNLPIDVENGIIPTLNTTGLIKVGGKYKQVNQVFYLGNGSFEGTYTDNNTESYYCFPFSCLDYYDGVEPGVVTDTVVEMQ